MPNAKTVLRKLAAMVDGVDNGYCTLCRRHRLYSGGKPGRCENPDCLSHDIAAVLKGG